MVSIIEKTDSISNVADELDAHGIGMRYGWEISMSMLLSECDYLEIHGFGPKAYFTKVYNRKEEVINEAAKEVNSCV